MFERYSELARQAIFFARINAGEVGAVSIDTGHLLNGILTVDPELPDRFAIGVDAAFMRKQLENSQHRGTAIPNTVDLPISSDLGRVLERATSVADSQQCSEIRTEHLFVSVVEIGGDTTEAIADLQIEKEALLNVLLKMDFSKSQKETEESRRVIRRKLL